MVGGGFEISHKIIKIFDSILFCFCQVLESLQNNLRNEPEGCLCLVRHDCTALHLNSAGRMVKMNGGTSTGIRPGGEGESYQSVCLKSSLIICNFNITNIDSNITKSKG